MKKKSSKNAILAIVIVVIVAGAVYFYFQGRGGPASGAIEVVDQTASVGSDVDFLLNQIQELHIDTTLFDDPAYETLVDHEVPVPEQNVGRPNPFAPIPGVSTTTGAR